MDYERGQGEKAEHSERGRLLLNNGFDDEPRFELSNNPSTSLYACELVAMLEILGYGFKQPEAQKRNRGRPKKSGR